MQHIAFLESNISGTGFKALQVAKELGHHVTFLTQNIDRYILTSEARKYFYSYVDDVVICRTNNTEDVINAVETNIPGLDALLAMGEYQVAIAAEVAQRISLRGTNPKAVQIARNKLWTRNQCQKAGLLVPKFISVETLEEAKSAAIEIGFPCIVKPVDGSGSTNVRLCLTPIELEDHFCLIQNTSVNVHGQPHDPKILIEEYLLGYEVSVETLTWEAQTYVIGITDKHLSSVPYFIEMGHTFPSYLPESLTQTCAKIAKQALWAIGYDLGPAHVELKITKQGPMLVEINARLAGDNITDLIEYSLGLNIVEKVICLYLGESLDMQFEAPQKGASVRFFTPPPGIIRAIQGKNLAMELPGVVHLSIRAQPGSVIYPHYKNRDRLGYVLAVGETPYVASRIAETAHLQIQFLMENA